MVTSLREIQICKRLFTEKGELDSAIERVPLLVDNPATVVPTAGFCAFARLALASYDQLGFMSAYMNSLTVRYLFAPCNQPSVGWW